MLELWTGIIGNQKLKQEAESARKNREAEESHARKHVWGYNTEQDQSGHEDMGHTILGDVTNPAPIVYPPQKSSILPAVAAAVLGAMIPAAGVGGYLLSKAMTPAVEPGDDESVNLGLGRIEDYLKSED